MLEPLLTKPTRRSLPLLQTRPTKRSQCVDGPRPCPWASCRYHLAIDVVERYGTEFVRENPKYTGVDSCALDVAAQGSHTSKDLAPILGLTQMESKSIFAESTVALSEVAQALVADDEE